jgi:signal transduction histidine kinase
VVSADPALARRAVDNLITNAVRHAGAEEIVVRVAGGVVTVADRGPGIDLEVLPHLFTRFVISPTTGGSGLGLSIVREIAIAHGGTVEGHNRADGRGAEFILTFPT